MWKTNLACILYHHRFFDDQIVIFNAISGQTHIVNQLCGDVLELLQQCPLNSDCLAKELAQVNNFCLDNDWFSYIESMLADLDKVGLIEPVMS